MFRFAVYGHIQSTVLWETEEGAEKTLSDMRKKILDVLRKAGGESGSTDVNLELDLLEEIGNKE